MLSSMGNHDYDAARILYVSDYSTAANFSRFIIIRKKLDNVEGNGRSPGPGECFIQLHSKYSYHFLREAIPRSNNGYCQESVYSWWSADICHISLHPVPPRNVVSLEHSVVQS